MQNQHQIYGTTIYIGKNQLKTLFGELTAYTFQDLIHKGYIIALCHGDLHAKTLYTRLHSSCVTSQLMRSLDCDCKQQLNGAIKKISQSNGILFYLMQEGRGCGYVGKSRACMNVQFYEQKRQINTFQAYQMLGMQHDYRQYTVVKDILNILKINPQFILLTNNPDKITKFQKAGLKLKTVQSIQIQPNAFNQAYLISKQQYGHILLQTKTKVQKYEIPYQRIQPFVPYSIPECSRFVHVSSYYLPLKPVWDRIMISPQDFDRIFKQAGIKKSYQIVKDPARNNQHSYYTQLTDDQIQQNPEIFSKPNWFQINVHYDIVTHNDYLILKYGDCKEKGKTPIVRIHSESLFNRFPLTDVQYRDRYKRSLDQIIRNGCGLILIFYNDGRGSSFGYYVLNTAKHRNKIGVEQDKRDYFGAINLIKHYINLQNQIDVLTGQSSYGKLSQQFTKNSIKVRKFIKLSNQSQKQGIHSIQQRMRSVKTSAQVMFQNFNVNNLQAISLKIAQGLENKKGIFCTGIGSSEAHSKVLQEVFQQRIKFITPMKLSSLNPQSDILIVFSQNLSPNIICCINDLNFQNLIIITSIDPKERSLNKKKDQFIQKMKLNKTMFLTYPAENPDDTLIRVTGPFLGFCLIILLRKISLKPVSKQHISICIDKFLKEFFSLYETITNMSDQFIESLAQNKNLIICCDSPAINESQNIKFKMIQGAMINTHTTDYINFAHGTYQFIEHNQNYCVWFITKKNNKLHSKTIQMLSSPVNKVYTTFYDNEEYLPLQLQLQANYVTLQLIQILKINQIQWTGKSRQHILYEVYN